jgi:hypothetical protein
MAILWPAIVLALFASVQIATYFTARSLALTAAQAAVTAERQLGAHPGDGKARAEQLLARAGDWLTPPDSANSVGEPVYTGTGVSYTVRGRAISLVPGISWEIEQTAHGTLEQFTVNPAGTGGGGP